MTQGPTQRAAQNSIYRAPHAPVLLKGLNAAGRAWGRDGAAWVRLDTDDLIRRAQASTGLSDWGDEPLREPLEVLCHSFENDARLNLGGRIVVRNYLKRLLENRLRMQRDFTQHPEILDVEIHRPVFIVGLPRTGSTLLQRLLARDPAVRSLATWEMIFPSPPPDDASIATDPRIARAAFRIKMMNWGAPDFVTAHELVVDEPEECVGLLMTTLISNAYELMNDLSGYRSWFGQQDQRGSYRYFKRQLQLLGWRRPRDHWVLKCPVHLFGIKALLDVFPDATLVQTHRDPVSVMPSVCSLFSVVQTLLSDYADPRLLGSDWVERWAQGCDDASTLRAAGAEPRFVDVAYKQMISDPFVAVRDIYAARGETFTPEAEAAMRRWLAGNPQHKHGKHQYRLEDYGLTADQVNTRFASYRERFAAYL
ncbi:MAG: hypothetical protein JWQ90_610 [Hydrocarboniphaga sp.]|uniref:sulfotransferase family protein n=1 Tax=Hydrocarboniphaga sp. TaxID=2033016 RepID=UPI00262F8117|nr:sulfotransferase [Hydrocarboniphaga sp.]MDB5968160.1 hypothetical protein [Hydrocarboniphaga sp.]